jgi:hypothetical protein
VPELLLYLNRQRANSPVAGMCLGVLGYVPSCAWPSSIVLNVMKLVRGSYSSRVALTCFSLDPHQGTRIQRKCTCCFCPYLCQYVSFIRVLVARQVLIPSCRQFPLLLQRTETWQTLAMSSTDSVSLKAGHDGSRIDVLHWNAAPVCDGCR